MQTSYGSKNQETEIFVRKNWESFRKVGRPLSLSLCEGSLVKSVVITDR